jgi:hypothetical protein
VPLAREICRRYREEFPDEKSRYGEAGEAWCRHDNQYILQWALGAIAGYVDLERHISWLADVLDARQFPLQRLVRDLEIAAEVAGEILGAGEPVSGELAAAAEHLRRRLDTQ